MISKAAHNFPSLAKHPGSTLAERIRAARRSAGLSQASLADHCLVTASAVAQWEHPGGTRPALDRLKVIARVLKVPIDWLVSGGRLKLVDVQKEEDGEPPAVVLDSYAHTVQEEELLAAFRRMGLRAREHLLALAQEFSIARRKRL